MDVGPETYTVPGSIIPRKVAYILSKRLLLVSALLPSNKQRSHLVHSLVSHYKLLSSQGNTEDAVVQVVEPTPTSDKELAAYHDRAYLEFILDEKNMTASSEDDPRYAEFGLEDDCPTFTGLPEYVRLVAGASLTAARLLIQKKADITICWDGGRHHAHKSHASGFCYVADCVLAILALKHTPTPSQRRPRILYLDLDLHFSDGVSQAFAASTRGSSSPQVLTISIHHSGPGFFPASPLAELPDPASPSYDPYTISIPLARGASNATFAHIWPAVEDVVRAFGPDYAVVQCGVDGLAGDPCGVWNWSLGEAEGSLGWCVDRICNTWGCKTLLLGGGGYNSPNAARAWAYLTSIALRRPLLLDDPIPDHNTFPVYAPSFTLDVPSGMMQDLNTAEYLQLITKTLRTVLNSIHSDV
ncbi:histone deacetylase complex protein [Obba rivulosa]|uniref:histone deacetylase n=1 Tax=Obba rivulosa TaxID=1052685 RepID=A0A8E2AUS2_9APHY|nr:histone deacetylase complex protein [Obba rivulosa]